MRLVFLIGILLLGSIETAAYADFAAVSEATPSKSTAEDKFSSFDPPTPIAVKPAMTSAPLSVSGNEATGLEQRVAHLEQKIDYLQQLAIDQKLQDMQKNIQDMRGEIEVLTHQSKELDTQQRTLYADLDTRLTKAAETASSAKFVAPVPVSTSISNPTTLGASNAKPMASADEANNYQEAFDLIKTKQYSEAIERFQAYLKQYPHGYYSANVYYWLGELYLLSGDASKARTQFQQVEKNYANSEKMPDALIKLASIANNQSDFNLAKNYWDRVIKNYPNSSAARIAAAQLQALEKA